MSSEHLEAVAEKSRKKLFDALLELPIPREDAKALCDLASVAIIDCSKYLSQFTIEAVGAEMRKL